MDKPIAGKFLLEILTKGMYSNPMHVFREYIQNSADSIDNAISQGVLKSSEAEINIIIDAEKHNITIRDNGTGIPSNDARIKLLNVGASDKDGLSERGFRGIGRLAGLAYAETVVFVTSYSGEAKKTIMTCDCKKLLKLLQKSNHETEDVMETFTAITKLKEDIEDVEKHYFEVKMKGVPAESGLLDEEAASKYFAETAPVDFDTQQFIQAQKIREFFASKGFPITCYKILKGTRKKPIYKLYSRNLTTGKQERSKVDDHIRDVEFIYETASDGKPLYIGWLALTDFSGIITDDSIQGIRFRKGNILVGNNTTFSKFFPSEGHNANRMFAGEIHVLHDDLIPNSQRDDFEPSPRYEEMKRLLSVWAGRINRLYRRGTSVATSALRNLTQLNDEQKSLEEKIESGAITSDEKREKIAERLDQISRNRASEEKKVRKALENGTFDSDRVNTVMKALTQTEKAAKKVTSINKKIVNADYSTKEDLPSSYSREERKLYQRIISIIDSYFGDDTKTAEELRNKLKTELRDKKK